MDFNFNYFKKLIKPTFYLCNPDERFLSAMNVSDDEFTLRFNDISEVTFKVSKHLLNEEGNTIEFPFFDLIATKRLVFIDSIGWFQITNAVETDTGNDASKEVTCESLQTKLKDIGFTSEERVYKFYNPLDPKDELYDAGDESAIPSVVGQLYQQCGIECDLSSGVPVNGYDDWTITYIPDDLKYTSAKGDNNICRTLSEEEDQMAYDFIFSQVEESFEVVFNFDFLHKTIQVKQIAEVTQQKSDIYLSFDNLMDNLKVEEQADDIVTVLHCYGGNDLDIRTVNPTGKDYIVDFSYYMDEVNHNWMSQSLIDKLKAWNTLVTNNQTAYANLVTNLYNAYLAVNNLEVKKASIKVIANDLDNAQTEYAKKEVENDASTSLKNAGTFVEEVNIGEKSRDEDSQFNDTAFSGSVSFTCYDKAPVWDATNNKFVKSSSAQETTGTLESLAKNALVFGSTDYKYFIDDDDTTYCEVQKKLKNVYAEISAQELSDFYAYSGTETERLQHFGYYKVVANNVTTTSTQINIGNTGLVNSSGEYTLDIGDYVKIDACVGGFVRYDRYGNLKRWIDIYAEELQDIDDDIETEKSKTNGINDIEEDMQEISDALDLDAYLKDYPALAKELKSYWVEGSYDNDNISLLDSDSVREEITLAKQLYSAGKIDLQRVSQPKFSISASVINFLQIYEFKPFIEGLTLGEVITIEKNPSLFYMPALTEISFSFEDADNFTMTFSNSLKPNDTLFTFADLVQSASKTSRTVSSNWSDLMSYTKDKDKIDELLFNPYDSTLRAANDNMTNQEFVIDKSGIIGRKLLEDGYADEQMRITNNVILFTDDNWSTIKTALGKFVYQDDGVEKFAYGLLANVIVGELMITETLKIRNTNSSIVLDENGILIKNGDTTVLSADVNGNLTVRGTVYATSGSFEGAITATSLTLGQGVTIAYSNISGTPDLSDYVAISGGAMYSSDYSYTSGNYSTAGMRIDFANKYIRAMNFAISSDGKLYAKNADITGKITATSGSIGAFEITDDGLQSDYIVLDKDSIYFPSQAVFNLSNDVQIFNSNSVSYIATTGNQDFEIKNIGGAGIRFKANSASESVIQTITFTYSTRRVAGDDDYGVTYDDLIDLTYTIGNNGTLLTPQTFTVYYRYSHGMTSIFGDDIDTETVTYQVTVPAGSNSGTFTKKVSTYTSVWNYYVFHGLSNSYSENNSDFSSSVTYNTVNINTTNNILYSLGSFCPNESATSSSGYLLGDDSHVWRTIRAYTASITTSDQREKNTIIKIQSQYDSFFDKLSPVSFIYKNGDSGRTHIGFIAQDVESALINSGLTTMDFAGLCIGNDENHTYGLRYEEFIALNTYEIQKLKKRVLELENKLNN